MRYTAAIVAVLLAGSAGATDLPRVFMTSTEGLANLSSWPDAHGHTGLAAGDEICRTRAAAAGITDAASYIALLSDSTSDAYCRLHGLTGKRANLCGQSSLPVGAGPWYRMDDLPAIDIAERSMTAWPTGGYVPRPIVYNEFGAAFPITYPRTDIAFTSTDATGSLDTSGSCSDWAGTSQPPFTGGLGAYAGYGGDTGLPCSRPGRLVCVKPGQHGPALPIKRASTARVAFATAARGAGNLSSWSLAGANTGLAAGDAICAASAAAAGLPMASTFKAWLSSASTDAASRFVYDGPWYRVDGVRVTESIAAMLDGNLDAPLQMDENRQPLSNFDDRIWTGTLPNGQKGQFHCNDWSIGDSSAHGHDGRSAVAAVAWTAVDGSGATLCRSPGRIYCFADNDSLFFDGMEP
jgi:hypothetical protein